eukprot:2151714-Pyramimonas_sp.AAC.1
MHLPGYAATALVRVAPGTNVFPVKRDVSSISVRYGGGRGQMVSATAYSANNVISASHALAARSPFRTSMFGTSVRSSTSASRPRKSRSSRPTQAVALPMDPARATANPTPEAIPGDHMANARAGLPDGVSSMVVERFTLESGAEMKDVVVAYS